MCWLSLEESYSTQGCMLASLDNKWNVVCIHALWCHEEMEGVTLKCISSIGKTGQMQGGYLSQGAPVEALTWEKGAACLSLKRPDSVL